MPYWIRTSGLRISLPTTVFTAIPSMVYLWSGLSLHPCRVSDIQSLHSQLRKLTITMLENKTCSKCKQSKSISEFYNKSDRKSGSSHCKECFNKYCVQRWINKKKTAIESKGGNCVDCGLTLEESHYSVFEFHHLDPKLKDYDWTKLRLRSEQRIQLELARCILLCANCHRIRHANLGFPEQSESQ